MNLHSLLGMSIALTLLVAPEMAGKTPLLVWNASPSVARGLYRIERGQPQVGDLVLVRLAPGLAALAARRRYLPREALLIKPVAAAAGDIVCRHGVHVLVRGKLAAKAHGIDAAGRWLPSWNGCRTLLPDQLFLLVGHPTGFDSRYFGIVSDQSVVGRAFRIWPHAAPQ